MELSRKGRPRRALRALVPYLAIGLAVVVGNVISLTVTNPNPLLQRSGLPVSAGAFSKLGGFNTIDPNDGYTTQALGVAAARQLLHGQLPLWNFFEGLGQPLLAGMQSAALFPLVPLMLLPGGVLLFHMTLELIAGVGMLLLLRTLGLSPRVAVLGGVLFALNGTFAWLANAIVNPIAFLPWILLGIELARDSDSWRRARGWWLVAIAVALSLLAGFPEVAYLNGILAAVWALVRIPAARRKLVYLVSLAVGVGLGVAIAAPALQAFAEYVPQAWVGGHSGGMAGVAVHPMGAAMLVTPYIMGPIFSLYPYDPTGQLATVWGSVGGYLTIGSAGLAVIGLIAGRHKLLVLRIALAGWAVLCLSRIYGIPVLRLVLAHLPGAENIAEYRYLSAALTAAVIVLAAIGAEALIAEPVSRLLRLVCGLVLIAGAAVVLTLAAHASLTGLRGAPFLRAFVGASVGLAAAVVVALLLALFLGRGFMGRGFRAAVAPVVIFEALVLFLLPQLSAPPRSVVADTAPVTYLQDHLGEQRYFGLGILKPNYGSYFGVASLDENNLPVPESWKHYIGTLNTWALPDRFDGQWSAGPERPSPEAEVFQHLSRYEAAGMKYLVAGTGQVTAADAAHYGLRLAFGDTSVQIWQLPHPAAYLSAPGCTVTSADRDDARVDCASGSRLTRLELAFPGWQATVDGKAAALSDTGTFQQLAVPAGVHSVSFRYWPGYLTPSLLAAGLALMLLVGGVAAQLVARRRGSRLPAPLMLGTALQADASSEQDSHPESIRHD